MDLSTQLSQIPGIGSGYVWRLKQLGLETVNDLIHHYPFRYDDFSSLSSAGEAQLDTKVTLQGEIWSIQNIYTRYGKVLTQAVFNDGTIPITLTWFNQGWLTKQLKAGDRVQISGKLTKYKNKYTIMAPVWERLDISHQSSVIRQDNIHTGRLVPVYPETAGLSSKWIRTKIDTILPQVIHQINDPLPETIRDNMMPLQEAIQQVHFPKSWDLLNKARERLAFDELFYIQLATLKIRMTWKKHKSVPAFNIKTKKLEELYKSLPFKLTTAQLKVISEILADLQNGQPMNRLVQGEVGSGKTVVAVVSAYVAHLNGYKTLYMAPTEILAFQHYSTLTNLLEPFGISVGIYTGSRKRVQVTDIIVGTHALLSEKLTADNVGLIIVDEQQRFGVQQRSLLRSKAKIPHFLTMTATPIPRTVALTLYGDLDISVIYELPKGRQIVRTHVVPEKKRSDAYKFIEKQVKSGGQAYIITPLIEQSETLLSVKAAKIEYAKLQKKIFPHLKLGLLHGRLKSKEKEQVVNNFKDKKLDILISTSVVEVGMDITNATIMVIEGAERFGLAQLHQLRGRVGRGTKQSYCLLFPTIQDSSIILRLKNLEKINDGLKLAELDLKIRGSGEIFGIKQSGRIELKIASFSDLPLIEKARSAANKILQDNPQLDKHPLLLTQLQNLANVMPD